MRKYYAAGLLLIPLLMGCGSYAANPPGPPSASCAKIAPMDLSVLDEAVDNANNFGEGNSSNGATQLTSPQVKAMTADAPVLESLAGPAQFARSATLLGQVMADIAEPLQDRYVNNSQAPEFDRNERYLDSACNLPVN
jgi:hypothetical protein